MRPMWRVNSRVNAGLCSALTALGILSATIVSVHGQQPAPKPLTPGTSVIPQIRAPGQPPTPVPLNQPTTTGFPQTSVPLSGAPQNPLALPQAGAPPVALPAHVSSPIGTMVPAPKPLPPRASISGRSIGGKPPTGYATPSGVQPAAFFNDAPATPAPTTTTPTAQAGEHPLAPAIARAHTAMESIAKIQDYSATLVKRERIDGALGEHQYLFIKVRHNPFSVYLYFLAPAELKGQETIYIAGKNDGNLLAHPNGFKGKLLGTLSLSPTGMIAMSGNRYPITEVGVKRLTERLIEVGQNDMKYGECAVKILPGTKINGRDCTCYEVNHPQPRKEFIFHIARIYLDSELNVPIRYESYEWPSEKGGQPVLVEEYTYLNLKLNNGFTDLDFDVSNPKYQFK
jgi:hypothetical protein